MKCDRYIFIVKFIPKFIFTSESQSWLFVDAKCSTGDFTVMFCMQETEMAGVKTDSSPNQDKRPVQKVIPSRNLNYNSTPPAAALVS